MIYDQFYQPNDQSERELQRATEADNTLNMNLDVHDNHIEINDEWDPWDASTTVKYGIRLLNEDVTEEKQNSDTFDEHKAKPLPPGKYYAAGVRIRDNEIRAYEGDAENAVYKKNVCRGRGNGKGTYRFPDGICSMLGYNAYRRYAGGTRSDDAEHNGRQIYEKSRAPRYFQSD
jgi:hypothetical protein